MYNLDDRGRLAEIYLLSCHIDSYLFLGGGGGGKG